MELERILEFIKQGMRRMRMVIAIEQVRFVLSFLGYSRGGKEKNMKAWSERKKFSLLLAILVYV
jgi:hypothetical protein